MSLVIPFCSSLWAENDKIRADSLSPYDPQEYDAFKEDDVVSERDRREAQTQRRGGSSSGGAYKLTNYIKSLASGARIKLTKFLKGYSLTTSKQISVSVNPLGQSLRGSQSIDKIESKVRFQSKESDFLYYTLRGYSLQEVLFHLVLIENPEDSSKLYLGYYEEDEDSVIDTAVSSSTAVSIYLQDVLKKSDMPVSVNNGTNTNSTVLTPHSGQSSNDTFINANLTSHNTTGSQDLMPKRRVFKPFKPILSLEKKLDYSIAVVWKARAERTSVTLSDTGTMTHTTINPSSTRSSSISSSTRELLPEASAAIPENVGTQIIIKDQEGMALATLNLDLEPNYFSFSDENGYLLEYRIDGDGIHQLTEVQTDTEYVNGNGNRNRNGNLAKPEPACSIHCALALVVAIGLGCMGFAIIIVKYQDRRLERQHYRFQ
ncbi:hypothetical protein [Endozoicomonas sp. 8E]|uniref:hypothetical protein n=1 Tax=Endozoicomonas sp. 8E TaxID=3035692 RepID=UPI00293903E4|nr:hypothetical protein [Endozoicomonas sp. 8E]WOG25577.1 hypothetical protein P6910_13385 [Endozoicomonas sp. 8E]